MLTSKLGICGALCSVLLAATACGHDNTQTGSQTAYNPPSANNAVPSEYQSMTSGYQPQPGAANQQYSGTGSTTGLGNTTGSAMTSGTATSQTTTTTSGSMGGTSGMQTSPLTDDDIIALMQAINKAEIMDAQMAKNKAQSPDVKSLASTILTNHASALHQENMLTTQSHLTPNTSSTMYQDMTTEARQEMDSLQAKSGMDFDKAYVDAMVQGHQKALTLITDKLIPNAKDPQLMTQLQSLKSTVEMHLRMSMDAQQKLSGQTTTQPPQQQPPQPASTDRTGQTNSMPNPVGTGTAHP